MDTFDCKENTIQVTDFRLLSDLPELFTFENGERVVTASDWEKRRKEIFKTAVQKIICSTSTYSRRRFDIVFYLIFGFVNAG